MKKESAGKGAPDSIPPLESIRTLAPRTDFSPSLRERNYQLLLGTNQSLDQILAVLAVKPWPGQK